MELNQPAEDIDRTSINGKAAAIFLNRICMKDIGKLLRNVSWLLYEFITSWTRPNYSKDQIT